MKLDYRLVCFFLFFACAGLLGFGLYLQHVRHLEPCPLCILQRYAFILVGITGLVAGIHNPKKFGWGIYGALLALFAALGAGVAGRQIWLEYHPILECGPDLEFMLNQFPLTKAVPMMFKGGGDCGIVLWRFFGLSIPEWAAIWFFFFIATGITLVLRRKP